MFLLTWPFCCQKEKLGRKWGKITDIENTHHLTSLCRVIGFWMQVENMELLDSVERER